jgi:hypothetical protein
MPIPLKSKTTPAATAAPAGPGPADDTAPAEERPTRSAAGTPPRLAGTPAQGTDDDGSGYVPPPPKQPNGQFLSEVSRVNRWLKKDTGLPALDKEGKPSKPVVVFRVVDPKEAQLAQAGKESCYGNEEGTVRIDFEGQGYARTIKHLTDLGCPPSTWPKNAEGKTPIAALCRHVEDTTRGKRFLVTFKVNAGKGEHKGTPFVNIDKIAPPPAPARRPPPRPEASPSPTGDEASTRGEET